MIFLCVIIMDAKKNSRNWANEGYSWESGKDRHHTDIEIWIPIVISYIRCYNIHANALARSDKCILITQNTTNDNMHEMLHLANGLTHFTLLYAILRWKSYQDYFCLSCKVKQMEWKKKLVKTLPLEWCIHVSDTKKINATHGKSNGIYKVNSIPIHYYIWQYLGWQQSTIHQACTMLDSFFGVSVPCLASSSFRFQYSIQKQIALFSSMQLLPASKWRTRFLRAAR